MIWACDDCFSSSVHLFPYKKFTRLTMQVPTRGRIGLIPESQVGRTVWRSTTTRPGQTEVSHHDCQLHQAVSITDTFTLYIRLGTQADTSDPSWSI
jgi:hypothetical protein